MTAITTERLTDDIGAALPQRGTVPIAANTLIRKGWQVGLNASGQVVPADLLANGCVLAIGRAHHTVDNRTGSELGGSAAAAEVEVDYGVFGWENSAETDEIGEEDIGKPCFANDNQTVALTDGNGTRPPAGFVSEVRDGQVFVHQSPSFAKLASASASADAGVAMQKRSLTVTSEDLDADATTQVINIGAPLPANARILGVGIALATPFGGITGPVTVDIGSSGDADAIVDGANLQSAAVDGQASTRPAGIAPNKHFATATQLTATFLSDSGNLDDTDAGEATIDVLFAVLP